LFLNNLLDNFVSRSWRVPTGHNQPQKALPASKDTPRTPRKTEKLSGEVVFKVCPVPRYDQSVSIAPKGQNTSKAPPLEDSPGMICRSPIRIEPIRNMIWITVRVEISEGLLF